MGISTQILDVCIPSGIFCYRNFKKATDDSKDGEKARGTVAFAQGAKIVEAITKYNDTTANSAKSAISVFDKYAKQYKAVDYAGKAIKWATHNVNPLICASAGIKVLTADDKVDTGITQLGALSGMFLGEGLMKLHMGKVVNEENVAKFAEKYKDTKGLKKITQYLMKAGTAGKAASILKGLLFVCGSMTAFDIGEKIGKNTSQRLCHDFGINNSQKINQKA